MRCCKWVREEQGLSLLETSMALALGAVVLLTAAKSFQVAQSQWHKNKLKSEIYQHCLLALDRLAMELRYAEAVTEIGSDTPLWQRELIFDTKHLEDDDDELESIRYALPTQMLVRQIKDGPSGTFQPVNGYGGDVVAGDIFSNSFYTTTVTEFERTPLKVDAGNNLVPLAIPGADTLDDAVAMRVGLTLQDEDGDEYTVSTVVKLRNK